MDSEQMVEERNDDEDPWAAWKRRVDARYERLLAGREGEYLNPAYPTIQRVTADEVAGWLEARLRHGENDQWIFNLVGTPLRVHLGVEIGEDIQFLQGVLDDARRLGVHWSQWVPRDFVHWVGGSKARTREEGVVNEEKRETVVQPSGQQESSTSRLLQLPSELRLAILELAVGRTYDGTNGPLPHRGRELHGLLVPHYTCPPALTRVSRQLRAEGLAAFYRENVFVLMLYSPADVTAAQEWLRRIGDEQVALLRHIVLTGRTEVGPSGENSSMQIGVNLSSFTMNDIMIWETGSFKPPPKNIVVDPELITRLCKYGSELRTAAEENGGEVTGHILETTLLAGFRRECEEGRWWKDAGGE